MSSNNTVFLAGFKTKQIIYARKSNLNKNTVYIANTQQVLCKTKTSLSSPKHKMLQHA